MSLLVKGGITKLSELEIDADKDWLAQGITNIKEIAASMAKGDLAVRGNTVLVKFPPKLNRPSSNLRWPRTYANLDARCSVGILPACADRAHSC